MFQSLIFLFFLVSFTVGSDKVTSSGDPQLVVRVKEDELCPDDDAFDENFNVDLENDLVTLSFYVPNGVHVTEMTDFRKDVIAYRLTVIGEVERGDEPVQTFCFATKQPTSSLLTPNSILRLRQKNPESLKWAEEDKGAEDKLFDIALNAESAEAVLGVTVTSLCQDTNTVFMLNDEYKAIISNPDSNVDDEAPSMDIQHLKTASLPSCSSVSAAETPCQCELQFCIPWYPCGWKLCKNKNAMDNQNYVSTYKCGIRSCKSCKHFHFEVSSKKECMWNESLD